MHAFDVLGDPVRRRILELLAGGEQSSGDVVEVISEEFGIGQPAVSMQLKVLRESGFATRPRRRPAPPLRDRLRHRWPRSTRGCRRSAGSGSSGSTHSTPSCAAGVASLAVCA